MSGVLGVVLKQSGFGEGNRMLWIITREFGIVKAVARGALKTKSRISSATQFLSFSEFEFHQSGEVWNINNVTPQDGFWGIQEDISKLSLCTYLCDLVYYSVDLHNPDENVYRMLLNTLYALSNRKTPLDVVKATFELKLMYIVGFLPNPAGCASCGVVDKIGYFDMENGGVYCGDCKRINAIYLDENAYKVLVFMTCSDLKKMFSFDLPKDAVKKIGKIAEDYTLKVLEKEIKSLSYYKMFI